MKQISLSRERGRLGLSAIEMAKLLGVSHQTISKWENGVTNIPPKRREAVARHYQIPIDNLVEFCESFSQDKKTASDLIRSIKKDPKGPSSGPASAVFHKAPHGQGRD